MKHLNEKHAISLPVHYKFQVKKMLKSHCFLLHDPALPLLERHLPAAPPVFGDTIVQHL